MRTFSCPCGNRLHFENTQCLVCDLPLVYNPAFDRFSPLAEALHCAHRERLACNWIQLPGSPYCASCATTTRTPSLDNAKNVARLAALERAKRRMLRTLILIGVWNSDGTGAGGIGHSLTFEFLESFPGGPEVITGHSDGVVTINVVEADDDQREYARERLHEPYRTLLGHLRHEVGHFYWDRLVKDRPALGEFRQRFGDDREDYAAAMERYYQGGPMAGWEHHHVSAYATMHPWEDWAETWAHMMHRHDTLETATDAGLAIEHGPGGGSLTPFIGVAGAGEDEAARFVHESGRWLGAIVIANELSRSMGQPDTYPFTPGEEAIAKIFFAERVAAGRYGTA